MNSPECPGCGHRPLASHRSYCPPCERRLPETLRTSVRAAETGLRRALADATVWLKQHPKITPRELDIVELASHGMSNTEIAGKLTITEDTVKSALAAISRRWGCRGRASRTHMIATAFRLGYLRTERTEKSL